MTYSDSGESFKERWLAQPDSKGSINLMNDFSVKKEITISKLLNNLDLDPRTCVLVNSKEINFEDFDNVILKPQDEIALLPFTSAAADPQNKDVTASINLGDKHQKKGITIEYNPDTIDAIYSRLFGPDYDLKKPSDPLQQIIYRSELILEARKVLKSTKYIGLDVFHDGVNIDPNIMMVLQDKHNKGVELTRLERIIKEIACFYMGGRDTEKFDSTQEKDQDKVEESYSKLQASTTNFIKDLQKGEKQYSTTELIGDIKSELQKLPEAMAVLWPERVKRLNNNDMARFWTDKISVVRWGLAQEKKNPNYKFIEKNLNLLEEKSIDTFGENAIELVQMIRDHRAGELTVTQFVEKVRAELGRISGIIEVGDKEMSQIFGMEDTYISGINSRITIPSHRNYAPDFKFSKEVLFDLMRNLEPLAYTFRELTNAITRYIALNPDLKDYSKQQYTITNPDFFSDMFSVVPSYWFGFMSADGWTYNNPSKDGYGIGMQLSAKDIKHLYKFADELGYDRSRMEPKPRIVNDGGEIKIFMSSSVSFGCRPMWLTLKEEGLYGSKSERKSVPVYVKESIEMAKREADNLDIHWSETHFGKIAHAWLLGFYDGDGSYGGGYSALIGGNSEELLLEIKDLFEIKNPVHMKTKPGTQRSIYGKDFISKGYWVLTLGPDVFKSMLLAYRDSLGRKRAQ